MNTHLNQSTTIDISDLPSNARQEIQDFYAFLRTKYVSKQEQDENVKLRFFKKCKKAQFSFAERLFFQ